MDRPKTGPEKVTKTVVDTIGFSKKEAESWKLPPFQRQLKVNEKVRSLAARIGADGGVIPGIVTFGKLGPETFLLDGQHRRQSFLLSGKEEGFADARTCYFGTMAEMGEEYVRLNSQLVKMGPDDILRGLEQSLPQLKKIRSACPFVGYDMIRRNDRAPILSMSVLLRSWERSRADVPSNSSPTAAVIAEALQDDDVKQITAYLQSCYKAWGNDREYQRLWSALNLVLCMWLYRRVVLAAYSARTERLAPDLFVKCLMSLSADQHYGDWLVGRHLSETDRAPAYSRITAIFGKRLHEETGKKASFPRPPWALGKKSR